MTPPKRAPLTAGELRDLVREHGSWAAIARHLGVNPSTVKTRASVLGVTLGNAEAPEPRVVTSDNPREWGDIRAMLERRGLDLDHDWTVARARVNSWGGPDGEDNAQLRVDLEPRAGLIMPARTEGWRPPKVPKRDLGDGPQLTVVCADHHVPMHSKPLHSAMVAWLAEHRPHMGIIAGDAMDYGAASRHRTDPSRSYTLQETVDQTWEVLRDYVQASPETAWHIISGNHEDRLRNLVLDQTPLHGLRQADPQPEDYPVLSVPHLIRADELGITYHGSTDDDYRHAQVQITSDLACRHGWIASKGAGSSALKTLQALRYSVLVGHTHRQSIVHHSAFSITGEAVTLLGCEVGCMAEIDSTGMGYAPNADWQNGWATVTSWPASDKYPNGTFSVDLATFVEGRLMWRDWSVSP